MSKKLNLPIVQDVAGDTAREPAKKPSLEAARSRLGGAPSDGPAAAGFPPGRAVSFRASDGTRRNAVVVYAGSSEVHVLLDRQHLRRLPATELEDHEAPLDDELAQLATDARVFGALRQGQSVRYANESGELVDGQLVEKCRWGALVAREDGALVAVGFRKLWPAPDAAGAERAS